MTDDDRARKRARKRAGRAEWSARRLGGHRPGTTDITITPWTYATVAEVPDRAPRDGSPSWVSSGPRNVGGRVRALAVDPLDPHTLYAGSALGGVFRSRDDGDIWEPLWFATASMSIGAIAVGVRGAAAHHRVIWVATGEKDKTPTAGVWRYDESDPTPAWHRVATPTDLRVPWDAHAEENVEALDPPTGLEAIAIDPADPDHVWIASPSGLYRCIATLRAPPDASAADPHVYQWNCFHVARKEVRAGTPPVVVVAARAATGYGDVKLVRTGATTELYAALDKSTRGDIIRLPDAHAAAATIAAQLALAANLTQPLGAPAGAHENPINAKLALVPHDPDRIYAVYASAQVIDGRGRNAFRAIARGVRPAAPPDNFSAWAWDTATQSTNTATIHSPDFTSTDNDQGEYNLALAVGPVRLAGAPPAPAHAGDVLVFGLIDAHVSRDGGLNWFQAIDWTLFNRPGLRAHHADQHAIVFDHAVPSRLWLGNDGGVSMSTNYDSATATDPRGFNWVRYIDGLTISQSFDLTQSPSMPQQFGVGLLDQGVWMSTGGASFLHVGDGDGLAIAFDPTDPYCVLANSQGDPESVDGVQQIRYGGDMAMARGARRTLGQGVIRGESADWNDTVAHPTRSGRAISLRERHAYLTRDGEVWQPIAIGDRLEIVFTPSQPSPWPAGVGRAVIRIADTAGARKLGLRAGEIEHRQTLGPGAAGAAPAVYTVRAISAHPVLPLADGDTLALDLELTPPGAAPPGAAPIVHPAAIAFTAANVGKAVASLTVGELVDFVHRELFNADPAARCLSMLGPWPYAIELFSNAAGAAAAIAVSGTAAASFGVRVPAAAPGTRTFAGAAGRSAIVSLICDRSLDGDAGSALPDLPADSELVVTVGANTATVAIGARTHPFDATALARQIDDGLRDAGVAASARATRIKKSLRLRYTIAGAGFSLPAAAAMPAGSTDVRARFIAGEPGRVPDGNPRTDALLVPDRWGRYLLHTGPPPLPASWTIVVDDGAGPVPVTFTSAAFPTAEVTVEEARSAFVAALAGHPVDCEVVNEVVTGRPTEAAYSPADPDVIWLGAIDGSMYRSRDGGTTWQMMTTPPEALRTIEAIAPHPTDAAQVWIGQSDYYSASGTSHVWKTSDGQSWSAAGNDIAIPDHYAAPYPGLRPHVNALASDPGAPDHLFAATAFGVMKSDNGGGSWSHLIDGLPNVPATDLDIAPGTRRLRVGTFGRGTFTRPLDGDGWKDVALALRTSIADDGWARPPLEGFDAGAAVPTHARRWESPDIKVVSNLIARHGAVIDGREMDEELDHEPVSDLAPSHVLVQVHNCGSKPATSHRVVVLWCNASAEIPSIPPAYWTSFSAADLSPGWTVIGNANLDAIASGSLRVSQLDYTWPASVAAMHRVAILAVVTSPDDRLETTEYDIGRLVLTQRKAALRVSEVRPGASARRVAVTAARAQISAIAGNAQGILDFAPPAGPLPSPIVRTSAPAAPAGFDLTPASPPALLFTLTASHEIDLSGSEFAAARDRVTAAQLITAVRREIEAHAVPLAVARAVTNRLALFSSGAWRITAVGGGLAAVLPLTPVGGGFPANFVWAPVPTTPHPVTPGVLVHNLTAAATLTLRFDVTAIASFDLSTFDFAVEHRLAAIRPEELRRALDRAFFRDGWPLHATIPRADLVIRRFGGEGDEARGTAPPWSAEIAIAPGGVVPGAEPPLFDLIAQLATPRVSTTANQGIIVRVLNQGDLHCTGAEVSLFWLDPLVTPSPTPLGTMTIDVPAHGVAFAQFLTHPGAPTGDHVALLAAVRHDDDPTDLPIPSLALTSWFSLDAYCRDNDNLAYRVLPTS